MRSTHYHNMVSSSSSSNTNGNNNNIVVRVFIALLISVYVLVVLGFLQTYMIEFQQQQSASSSYQSTSSNNYNNNKSSDYDFDFDYMNEHYYSTNHTTRSPRTLPLPLDVTTNKRPQQRGVVLFYNVGGSAAAGIRIRPVRMHSGGDNDDDAIKFHFLTKRPGDDHDSLTKTTFPLVERILQRQQLCDDDLNYNILFLELQAGGRSSSNKRNDIRPIIPSLMELRHEIQYWRQLAVQYETFFFAFTILEHPVSFHVQQFNQFHADNNNDAIISTNQQAPLCSSLSNKNNQWCQQQQQQRQQDASVNRTTTSTTSLEEQLLRTIQGNDQCSILLGNHQHYRHYNDDSSSNNTFDVVTKRDCQMVYQFMVSNLDWIGTTSSTAISAGLQSTTATATNLLLLPSILEHLLHVPFSLQLSKRNTVSGNKRLQEQQQEQQSSLMRNNVNSDIIDVSSLRSSTIEAIMQNVSALDLELYQRASQDYATLPPGILLVHHDNININHSNDYGDSTESTNDDDDEYYDVYDNDKDYDFVSSDSSQDNSMEDLSSQQEFVTALAQFS